MPVTMPKKATELESQEEVLTGITVHEAASPQLVQRGAELELRPGEGLDGEAQGSTKSNFRWLGWTIWPC